LVFHLDTLDKVVYNTVMCAYGRIFPFEDIFRIYPKTGEKSRGKKC